MLVSAVHAEDEAPKCFLYPHTQCHNITNNVAVVGFLNASFSGVEQGSGYNVPVGYLKGGTVAGQNLVFDVENTPGTASEFTIILIILMN